MCKTQNAATEKTLNSPEFLKTNEELINSKKQREEEKIRNELLKAEKAKQMENLKISAEIKSAPDKKQLKQ